MSYKNGQPHVRSIISEYISGLFLLWLSCEGGAGVIGGRETAVFLPLYLSLAAISGGREREGAFCSTVFRGAMYSSVSESVSISMTPGMTLPWLGIRELGGHGDTGRRAHFGDT